MSKCIVMDPPWPEQGGGKIKRGADRHYKLIKKKEDILRVVLRAERKIIYPSMGGGTHEKVLPVFSPDPEGCHLWIWVTSNYLPWGLWLMDALGFTYKREFAWVKAVEYLSAKIFILERPGIGQYSMGQHELLLFGTRGKAMKPAAKDRPRSVITAPRPKDADGKMIHSAKPPEAYAMIEKVSLEPRLEMFARQPREGWTVWGDEVE